MSTPRPSQIPRGFRFAAAACGLKKTGGLDLALISSDTPASAAAVFTTNLVQAAPVVLSREHVRKSARSMHAIVVNSGNANCCTGREGMRASRDTAASVARELGCMPDEVIVCSTGVIGVPMKVEKILSALPALANSRSARGESFDAVTHAIMTTDTRPKWAAASCRIAGKTVRVLGCAKGAGMIHPNMATMLAFVLTDAAITPVLLRRALREVTARTFNSITVDGDTSTNDTLGVLANGASGAPPIRLLPDSLRKGNRWRGDLSSYTLFCNSLAKVCVHLALEIVRDGEGAQRVVEIKVCGARSDRDARRIALTIAHSPLVKTALAGADPNWGRILAAAGRAGVRFDPNRTRISLAGIPVFRRGRPLPFDEAAAHQAMLAKTITMVVDLGERTLRRNSKTENRKSESTRHTSLATRLSRAKSRSYSSRIWTCDFTGEYVRINASYRT